MMTLGIITDATAEGIRQVASYGLHAAEFCYNIGNDTKALKAILPEIKAACEECDVRVMSIGRWGTDKLNPDGSFIEDELQSTYDLIDVCEELGTPVFNTGVNWLNGLGDDDLDKNCAFAVKWLGAVIDYARPKGVKIAVYNCDWNNYIVNPRTWSRVLSALPELGIKYDPSHCLNEGSHDYLGEMMDWTDRFYHFHIKGTLEINNRHVDDPPAGLDMINWRAVMGVLYKFGYDGMLSIEPHSHTWRGDLGEWGIRFTIDYIRPMIYGGK